MQRVLLVLEPRHRLLHLRASLERKWSQPRRHSMYVGPSLNSKLCHWEGTTSWPQIWENYRTKRPFFAHNLRKRYMKRDFQGIHHRFLNDPEFRASQLEHDRNEEVCIKMDELEQKDFRHHMTQAEYFRYRKNWWISLNISRRSGPLRDRSDFNDALSTLNHLHQESGERQLRPVPFKKYQQRHQSSSSSSSWWQWSDSWWSSQ